jgi:hypothetical protein
VTPIVTQLPFQDKKMPVTHWITGKYNREASRLGDVGSESGAAAPRPDRECCDAALNIT